MVAKSKPCAGQFAYNHIQEVGPAIESHPDISEETKDRIIANLILMTARICKDYCECLHCMVLAASYYKLLKLKDGRLESFMLDVNVHPDGSYTYTPPTMATLEARDKERQKVKREKSKKASPATTPDNSDNTLKPTKVSTRRKTKSNGG